MRRSAGWGTWVGFVGATESADAQGGGGAGLRVARRGRSRGQVAVGGGSVNAGPAAGVERALGSPGFGGGVRLGNTLAHLVGDVRGVSR